MASEVSVGSLKQRMQDIASELNKYKELSSKSEKELQVKLATNKQLDSEIRELNRKATLMEDELDQQTARCNTTKEKLLETSKVAEECDKQRRLLDHRRIVDEDRLGELEQIFRETSEIAVESERRYDDVSRKLTAAEEELAKVLNKTEQAELNAKNMKEDLKTLNFKLKSMQTKIEKAKEKESSYDKIIDDLRSQLQKAENDGNQADKISSKLQKELDHLQDELLNAKLHYQSISAKH